MSNITISDYYSSLDRKDKKLFRLAVCGTIGIEYNNFIYRLRNNKWNKLERSAITEIIQSRSYEEY